MLKTQTIRPDIFFTPEYPALLQTMGMTTISFYFCFLRCQYLLCSVLFVQSYLGCLHGGNRFLCPSLLSSTNHPTYVKVPDKRCREENYRNRYYQCYYHLPRHFFHLLSYFSLSSSPISAYHPNRRYSFRRDTYLQPLKAPNILFVNHRFVLTGNRLI